ncbi:hypothetical protein ACLK1T_19790 [Escherichia coli]
MLRFDFSHDEAMKPEEIRAVEDQVDAGWWRFADRTNIMISKRRKRKVRWRCSARSMMSAYACWAWAISPRLCGGTHASRTGDIGLFSHHL